MRGMNEGEGLAERVFSSRAEYKRAPNGALVLSNVDCGGECRVMIGSGEVARAESRLGSLCVTAKKQEIIKVTEQLIESINNGDFEAYS
ncbi:hypothetical protein NFI96_006095 [Prochilodus magdalenae]|nr:hypothetical protein NFI96_006095 [Prochilodus magdalenae]